MTLPGNRRLVPSPGFRRIPSDAQRSGIELVDGQLLPISASDEARLRYNRVTNNLEVSLNTGPYLEVLVAGAAGLVTSIEPGTVNAMGLTDGSVFVASPAVDGGTYRNDLNVAAGAITMPTNPTVNGGMGQWSLDKLDVDETLTLDAAGYLAHGASPAASGALRLSAADVIRRADGQDAQMAFAPEAFGAVGDLQTVTDGITAAGDATVLSASNLWTAADVGKTVRIRTAGVAGADLVTTWAAYNGPGSMELSVAATGAVNPATIDWATDDGAALQLWLDALKAAKGTGKLSNKRYATLRNLGLTSATGVTIEGEGMGASSIEDLRADDTVGAPTGIYYGLLSFDHCHQANVEKCTVVGSVASPITGVHTTTVGRKGIYHQECTHCHVHSVEATRTRDEAIYCQSTSGHTAEGWEAKGCYVHDVVCNGINANCLTDHTFTKDQGMRIIGNVVLNTRYSAMQLVSNSMAVIGNTVSNGTTHATPGWLVTLDISGTCTFSGNVLTNTLINDESMSALEIAGQADAKANTIISDNVFSGLSGHWSADGPDYYGGGIIGVYGLTGTMSISGNTFTQCAQTVEGHNKAIALNRLGATAVVSINGNTIRNDGNGYLRTGVASYASAPGARVLIGKNQMVDVVHDYTSDTCDLIYEDSRAVAVSCTATDATATELTRDNAAASETNRLTVPTGETWEVELSVVATCVAGDDVGTAATWTQRASIANVAGTTALVGDVMNLDSTGAWESAAFTPRASAAALAAATFELTASAGNSALVPTFTGVAAGVTPNEFRVRAEATIVSANRPFDMLTELAPDQWLRSDAGVTLVGSDVSVWADQSGNGNDVSQAVGNRPSFDNTGDYPVIVFDAANSERLHCGALAVPAAYTAIMVCRLPDTAPLALAVDSDSADGWSYGGSGGPTRQSLAHAGVAELAPKLELELLTMAHVMRWDGSVISLQADQRTLFSAPCESIGGAGAGDFSLGAQSDGTNPCNMELAEYVYWDRALSDAEVRRVISYMRDSYNLVQGVRGEWAPCCCSPALALFTTTDLSQSHTLRVDSGVRFSVYWGEGAWEEYVGTGASQVITHNYGGAGTYYQMWLIDRPDAVQYWYTNGNSLTGPCPQLDHLTNVVSVQMYTNGFSGPIRELGTKPALTHFDCYTGSLTGTIPSLSGCPALYRFRVFGHSLTGYTASTLATTIEIFHVGTNALSQPAIDQILADFETNVAARPAVVTLTLNGGTNAAPSAAGLASKANILAAKPGWVILHN